MTNKPDTSWTDVSIAVLKMIGLPGVIAAGVGYLGFQFYKLASESQKAFQDSERRSYDVQRATLESTNHLLTESYSRMSTISFEQVNLLKEAMDLRQQLEARKKEAEESISNLSIQAKSIEDTTRQQTIKLEATMLELDRKTQDLEKTTENLSAAGGEAERRKTQLRELCQSVLEDDDLKERPIWRVATNILEGETNIAKGLERVMHFDVSPA